MHSKNYLNNHWTFKCLLHIKNLIFLLNFRNSKDKFYTRDRIRSRKNKELKTNNKLPKNSWKIFDFQLEPLLQMYPYYYSFVKEDGDKKTLFNFSHYTALRTTTFLSFCLLMGPKSYIKIQKQRSSSNRPYLLYLKDLTNRSPFSHNVAMLFCIFFIPFPPVYHVNQSYLVRLWNVAGMSWSVATNEQTKSGIFSSCFSSKIAPFCLLIHCDTSKTFRRQASDV